MHGLEAREDEDDMSATNPRTEQTLKDLVQRIKEKIMRNKAERQAKREPEEQTCSICQLPYEGLGHDASPVSSGRCCETCNWSEVIPARIKAIPKDDSRAA